MRRGVGSACRLAGFDFYASDVLVREAVQREHPNWKWDAHDDEIQDVSKELWARWSAMDAVARQPYEKLAAAEKALFAAKAASAREA